jgi:uncharacterized protein (DUF305 family)
MTPNADTTNQHPGMTGVIKSDHDFLAQMIAHHRAAIDMSRAVLSHSSNDQVRSLASNIVNNQGGEIADMRRLLRETRAPNGNASCSCVNVKRV